MSEYDVIVIGSGAGGGTLVRRLAPSGKRVLLLERGDWLPREPQNWQAADVFIDNRYVSADTWYDDADRPFQPQVHYFVGGATKLYGAALYRLRAEDFGELRHRDGLSPAWPVSYAEMEPYYAEAERMYQVHGARGEDPTEPPSSSDYPHPAVSHEPRIQQLADDLAALGRQPFHAPCGILLDERDPPHSTCIRCAACDGFPCLVHAKSDAEVLGVRPALEHPNVTLLTGAHVVRLETDDAGGSVTQVLVERNGVPESYSADIVVVSCGAANSAKLLLASASAAHPNGLANGSGQVGRNYMFHNSQAVLALSKEPNPTVFQKTLGLNDFYFGADGFDYPLGNIQMVGKSSADMYRGEKPLQTRLAPQWTLDRVAEHAVDFWLSTEDLPRPENRVTLRDDGSISLAYRPTNEEPKQRLLHELKAMLGDIGMHHDHLVPRNAYLKNEIPVAGVAHQAGTCRFGSDPATSVLDVDCRAHEVDNLYVVDTSFFPSIGAVNPALTAMANAVRVGERILDRLGASPAAAEPSSGAQHVDRPGHDEDDHRVGDQRGDGHEALRPAGQGHRVRRADGDRVGQRHVQVVAEPGGPSGARPRVLGELEVGIVAPALGTQPRPALVELPEQQAEGDDVRQPDDRPVRQQVAGAQARGARAGQGGEQDSHGDGIRGHQEPEQSDAGISHPSRPQPCGGRDEQEQHEQQRGCRQQRPHPPVEVEDAPALGRVDGGREGEQGHVEREDDDRLGARLAHGPAHPRVAFGVRVGGRRGQAPQPVTCRAGGRSSSSTRPRWASVNSRPIDGRTTTTATPNTIRTLVSVALGDAPASMVSTCGSR